MSELDLLVAAELLDPAAGGAEQFLAEALALLPSGWRARAVHVRGPEGPGLRLPERVERRPVEPPAAPGAYWRDKRLRREAIARGVERAIAVRRPDVVLTQLHAGPGAVAAAGEAGVPAVLRIPSYETLCKHAFDAGSTCLPASGCRGCPTALGLPAAERAELVASRAAHAAALAAARALVAPSAFVAGRVEEWSGRAATVVHSVDGRPPPGRRRGRGGGRRGPAGRPTRASTCCRRLARATSTAGSSSRASSPTAGRGGAAPAPERRAPRLPATRGPRGRRVRRPRPVGLAGAVRAPRLRSSRRWACRPARAVGGLPEVSSRARPRPPPTPARRSGPVGSARSPT
ncbi:MAG: hypothetical protein R3C15_12870 [Thermoleophilia bacterium]